MICLEFKKKYWESKKQTKWLILLNWLIWFQWLATSNLARLSQVVTSLILIPRPP